MRVATFARIRVFSRIVPFICLTIVAACSSGSGSGTGSTPPSQSSASAGAPGPGMVAAPSLGKGIWIGQGVLVDNLTVFAVYAKEPRDIGEFTTLERAMAAGEAEIREIGASGRDGPPDLREGNDLQNGADLGAARVDTLVVENRGKLPILILAGTIVKGGKQDRQIGEDFVVEPAKTVDISAFCVEQGRWSGTREGKETGGTFVPQKVLATGKVRAAGQHDKDQSEVWKEVAVANAAHDKKSASGTFLASVDDAELTRLRAVLAHKASAVLSTAPEQDKLVGLAYAVDGEVRGVRWFAGPKLFKLFQETLLETAAFEAITAHAEARATGKPLGPAVAAKEEAVFELTDDLMRAAETGREQEQGQVRRLKNAPKGYASELRYDKKGGSSADADADGAAEAAPITVDMLKKK